MGNMPLKPCNGCVYFKACGNTNRTEPCFGRKTKSEVKHEEKTGLHLFSKKR